MIRTKSNHVLRRAPPDTPTPAARCAPLPPPLPPYQPSHRPQISPCPPCSPPSSAPLSRRYDVFVCHSDEDSDLAQSLACFLEAPSNGLRCCLQERDCPAGAPCPLSCCRPCRTVTAAVTPHSKLCEGWLVLVSDAPGPVWRAHVTEDHPGCSKHAQITAPARTALPLHCGSEQQNFGYTQVYKAVLQCEYFVSTQVLDSWCLQVQISHLKNILCI